MLTLLPILFLLLSAVGVLIMGSLKRGTGYVWLVAFLSTLITWVGILAIHWFVPPVLNLHHWRLLDAATADLIRFEWNNLTWPYSMALISFALATLLTAPARFNKNSNPASWAAVMIFTAVGILGIIAGSPIALIFAWMMLDLGELSLIIAFRKTELFQRGVLTGLAIRIVGIFLLITALAHSYSTKVSLTFENIGTTEALLVIFAVVLRMGVLPLNLPVLPQMAAHRGLTSIVRFAAQLTALIPLARFPIFEEPPIWLSAGTTLTILGCFYGAVLWIFSSTEINGRPYWILSTGGLAILSVLHGTPSTSIVWGVLLVLGGGSIFLYSLRNKWLMLLPAISLLGLSGLPFTPSSGGWTAFPNTFGWNCIISGILFLLLVGGFKHLSQEGEEVAGVEKWGIASYSAGLGLLVVAQGVIGFLGLPAKPELGHWVFSICIVLVLGLGVFWMMRYGNMQISAGGHGNWVFMLLGVVGERLGDFLTMGWLFRFLNFVFHIFQSVAIAMERLLEGSGGVLWAMLLLTLLITILTQVFKG